MPSVMTPAGPLQQTAQVFLLRVALSKDVLLIRLFLSIAYIWLLAAAAAGLPPWPSVKSDHVAVDAVVWAVVSGSFHIYAAARLLADGRPVRFRSEDEEKLWRFVNRRGGIGRLEMREVLRRGRWLRVRAGAPILSACEACTKLCLLVEGVASSPMYTAKHRAARRRRGWRTAACKLLAPGRRRAVSWRRRRPKASDLRHRQCMN
jgi:hypothetical protein